MVPPECLDVIMSSQCQLPTTVNLATLIYRQLPKDKRQRVIPSLIEKCSNGHKARLHTNHYGFEKATPRWFLPGSIPSTLTVSGVPSLKAVARLIVLVIALDYTGVYVLS